MAGLEQAWPRGCHSSVLAAILYGMCLIVFILTIWELWAPAKAIANDLAARYF
jgi:hypothetical protein